MIVEKEENSRFAVFNGCIAMVFLIPSNILLEDTYLCREIIFTYITSIRTIFLRQQRIKNKLKTHEPQAY